MNPILTQALGAAGTLGLFVFGIILMAYMNASTTPDTGPFSFKIFWQQNQDIFVRSLIWGVLITGLVTFVKEASEILQILGFVITVPISGGGAVMAGMIIYEGIRKKVRFQNIKLNGE